MRLIDDVKNSLIEHLETVKLLSDDSLQSICSFAVVICDSLSKGGTLFLCGNGGSASDSQHIAAELVGRFTVNRDTLRTIALTTDTSVLTCISNDFSYDEIFSRQLQALARPGDVLLVLSTSGNSSNVIKALSASASIGVVSIALLGKNGGLAKNNADFSLTVPSYSTARIQEVHILIGHIICQLIEKNLGFNS